MPTGTVKVSKYYFDNWIYQFNTTFVDEDGDTIRPIVCLEADGYKPVKPLHEAFRPSGRKDGSGPYFSAYYNSPSGVSTYLWRGPGYQKFCLDGYQELTFNQGAAMGWSVLAATGGKEIYSSYYHPSKPFGKDFSFHYTRLVGVDNSVPNGTRWLCVLVRLETDVGSIEAAKAVKDIMLRDARANPNAVSVYWYILPTLQQYTTLPEGIPYRYKERYNAEMYSLFDELIVPEYRQMMAQAYINVAEQLPQTTTNTIANILETASLITDLASGDFSGVGDLGDAWLGYRYQYSTTRSDILEYADLTFRLNQLASIPTMKCYGSYESGPIRCTVQCTIDASDFIPNSVKEWLKTYGLNFSLANAWDMVPYSFVADWFLPIGDFLGKLHAAGDMYALEPKSIWVTFESNYDGVNTYFRCPGEVLRTIPFVTFGGASGKTVGKRILDTIALFAP